MVSTRGLAVSGAKTRVGDGATRLVGDRLKFEVKPADKVVIGYLAIIATLILIFSYRIVLWGWFCVLQAALIGAVLLIAKHRPPAHSPNRAFARFLGGWYPVILIAITYKELTYLIPGIHPGDFDSTLAAIDHRMFGVHPTVWLERITWAPLTEVLQLTYSTYYFLPTILAAVLWRNRQFDLYYFLVFIIVSGMYLSYLGYIAVPAIGPRFLAEIASEQTKPLTGVFVFQTVRDALDRAEQITRDCFPSGHTELTLLVLFYARTFHRKVFWFLMPLGTGVIVSTVYLRYHYVIDVVAGALVAVAIVMIASPLHRWLGGKRVPGSTTPA